MTTPVGTLSIRDLARHYGPVRAVDGVSLEVPDGAFVCLLGPSGCGKTTLLRMLAGLETPSSGTIVLGGEDLSDVPPHRRGFGMVFQSLALFPHLDVGGNIAYALALRSATRGRKGRAVRAARVAELLELVRLPGIERRAITELSGGQRQRVAIARALALSPRLFLLDEPLSALDAGLREAMQVELRELQQRLGITTLVVTHDQREAMTMADLVVVMDQGKVRQVASPVELYRRPVDRFVAGFIGQTNLVEDPTGERGLLSIRPEDVRVVGTGEGHVTGEVRFVRDLGATVETFVDVGGAEIVAIAMPRDAHGARRGDAVGLAFDLERAVALPDVASADRPRAASGRPA